MCGGRAPTVTAFSSWPPSSSSSASSSLPLPSSSSSSSSAGWVMDWRSLIASSRASFAEIESRRSWTLDRLRHRLHPPHTPTHTTSYTVRALCQWKRPINIHEQIHTRSTGVYRFAVWGILENFTLTGCGHVAA